LDRLSPIVGGGKRALRPPRASSLALAVTERPTRLARKLGTTDAVVVGLGAMMGAGVFAAPGPAAEAAGSGLLLGLAVAAVVAYANATSSAQLAALYPESGGTYVYARRRLGRFWGFLAGWGFVVGKTASCAAMALTFGFYVAPAIARPLAIAAVVALVGVNLLGVAKTAAVTRLLVALVIVALAVVVAAALGGGSFEAGRLTPVTGDGGLYGILQAGGIFFFAFAGYARIATLGEEVREPERIIPRAVPLALGLTLLVYVAVVVAALGAAGAEALAGSNAPLATAVGAGSLAELDAVVRIGAAVASLGVLLSLLAGVGRTTFAMAANAELPHALAAVHDRTKIPHRAELAVGAAVVAVVAIADLREAIGFSSFAVLVYYAIANTAALTLGRNERRWPRPLAALGVAGCAVLAVTLPWQSVAAGAAVLAAGAVAHAFFVRFDAARAKET
jgi:basic amino acid/polyamine antiporter, APA family